MLRNGKYSFLQRTQNKTPLLQITSIGFPGFLRAVRICFWGMVIDGLQRPSAVMLAPFFSPNQSYEHVNTKMWFSLEAVFEYVNISNGLCVCLCAYVVNRRISGLLRSSLEVRWCLFWCWLIIVCVSVCVCVCVCECVFTLVHPLDCLWTGRNWFPGVNCVGTRAVMSHIWLSLCPLPLVTANVTKQTQLSH